MQIAEIQYFRHLALIISGVISDALNTISPSYKILSIYENFIIINYFVIFNRKYVESRI